MTKREAKTQVNVRIAPKLIMLLDGIGEPLGLTTTELIRRAIEEYVVNHSPAGLAAKPQTNQPRQQ